MRLRPYVLLLVLSLIIYLPVMMHAISLEVDFGGHIRRALSLPDSPRHITHVLFHAIFLFIHRLAWFIPRSLATAMAILAVMLPVPIITYALFKRAVDDAAPTALLIALSLALSIMAPITIWTDSGMLGYINPIVYHNPTMITARLFVIPLSLLAFRIFQGQPYRSLNQRVYILLLSTVTVLLGTLAKASFTFALLPACCLFALWRYFKRERVDWLLLLCGICLPGIFLMGLQYLIVYESADRTSTVAIGFLTTVREWIPIWRVPIQFLLSLVFPMAVFALYFERARRHLYLKMCWVIFAVAAAQMYFFYEDGQRLANGNFVWGSYNAIFLLMFASLLFLLKQHVRECKLGYGDWTVFSVRLSRKMALAYFLFGLHVISGCAYYFRFLTQYYR